MFCLIRCVGLLFRIWFWFKFVLYFYCFRFVLNFVLHFCYVCCGFVEFVLSMLLFYVFCFNSFCIVAICIRCFQIRVAFLLLISLLFQERNPCCIFVVFIWFSFNSRCIFFAIFYMVLFYSFRIFCFFVCFVFIRFVFLLFLYGCF